MVTEIYDWGLGIGVYSDLGRFLYCCDFGGGHISRQLK